MPEGLQAGRLEVTVVSVLDGFAAELRTKVETAAEGLAAKVKFEIDDKKLRKRLKTAVKDASAGLTATVNVRVDRDGLRGELEEVARRAADSDIRVPVRPDDDSTTGGGGLLSRIRGLLTRAQGEADQNPVNVPFQLGGSGRGRRGGRGRLRSLAMGAIVSLAQPAIAAVAQYGAGLTALVSAAAPAVGVLGAIPGLIAAAGTAAIAGKVAFGGFGEGLKQALKAQSQLAAGTKLTEAQQKALDQSLKGLSTSARSTVKTVASLSGAWRKMRQSVQERFFSKIADEVKPLSNAVLPLLKSSLGDAAGQLGGLAKRGAQAMKSGPFAKDFQTVAKTNSKVIGNITDGTANLAAATGHFLVASGPFVERVGEAGEKFTRWVRASAQAGRETGSLARFLDHAAVKAKQLGRTTLDLGKGLAGVGRAGRESGDRLLDGLEGTMQRFNRWANSDAGQFKMKEFFADAEPTFHELNMLVGDFVRGLGRMATDNGVTDLIRQIRVELMPAVGAFLNAIGGTVGPAVIGLISNIASAFASLSSAGIGLGTLLSALNGLLNIFNGLMNVVPGAGFALGAFLGTLLMLKIVTAISGRLQGLASSIRNVGTVSTTTAAGATTQASLWQRMGTAYTTAAASGGRLSGSMRAVGVAAGGLRTAAGGVVNALGGPLAAGLAAATIAAGLWASSQERSARATAAHRERISSLAQALRDSNGAIDANVRAQAAQLLQDTNVADGKDKLVDKMRDANVSLKELTDAYLDEGDGLKTLEGQLRKVAEANKVWEDSAGGKSTKQVYSEKGQAYRDAADGLAAMSGELSEGKQKYKEFADATSTSGNAGTDSFTRLKTAVEGMSSSTATADDRVNNLKQALDELTGGTESFHDAQTRVNAAVLSVNDAMKANEGKLKNAKRDLIGYDGSVNTATRSGQEFNTHLKELRDSAATAAVAAYDMAKANGTPLADALKTGQAEMSKAREAAIAYGRDLGLSKSQAEGLANQMGLMPSVVPTLFQAKGIPQVNAELLGLSSKLSTLEKGKSIPIKAPTAAAQTALRNLGFEVTKIPGSKKVNVSAPTGAASANMRALAADIASTPGSKKVTVQAIIKRATDDLSKVRDHVGAMKGKKLVMEAPTKTAQQHLKDLGYKIKGVKGKKVEVTAPTGTALEQVQKIQGRINQLTGKTVTVTIRYTTTGKPYAETSKKADGGIVRYAEGGIRRAGDRVRAFANGAENHIAQIAKPGEWRIWAEDETGGEAYVPLAKAKRKRSKAILDEVARIFGGTVMYPGEGALRQFANGAVSMYGNRNTRRTATASRASVPQGNTALVGGDLNINVGAVSTVGGAMEEAMWELRKIRLAGGGG
ncbi:hypothetical protein ACWGH2_42380 [Streptomyces sp. NPDC054871]